VKTQITKTKRIKGAINNPDFNYGEFATIKNQTESTSIKAKVANIAAIGGTYDRGPLLVGRKFHTKRFGDMSKAFISRPKFYIVGKQTSREQVQIHPTNPFTHQLMAIEKKQRFSVAGLNDRGQVLPKPHKLLSVFQVSTSQLANNHRMHTDLPLCQQSNEGIVAAAKIIYPNRRINQNHYSSVPDWRRGMDSSLGCEPPNWAKRRALSRSIRAFSPSRNRADFSLTPVNSTALAYKSSSIFSVVRMVNPRKHQKQHQCMPFMMIEPERTKYNRGAYP